MSDKPGSVERKDRKVGRVELAPLADDLITLYRRMKKAGDDQAREVLDRAIQVVSVVLEDPRLWAPAKPTEAKTTKTRGPTASWGRPPELSELFDIQEEREGTLLLVCRGCGFEFTLVEGGRYVCPNCGRQTPNRR